MYWLIIICFKERKVWKPLIKISSMISNWVSQLLNKFHYILTWVYQQSLYNITWTSRFMKILVFLVNTYNTLYKCRKYRKFWNEILKILTALGATSGFTFSVAVPASSFPPVEVMSSPFFIPSAAASASFLAAAALSGILFIILLGSLFIKTCWHSHDWVICDTL